MKIIKIRMLVDDFTIWFQFLKASLSRGKEKLPIKIIKLN